MYIGLCTQSLASCRISLGRNLQSPSSTWGSVMEVTSPMSPAYIDRGQLHVTCRHSTKRQRVTVHLDKNVSTHPKGTFKSCMSACINFVLGEIYNEWLYNLWERLLQLFCVCTCWRTFENHMIIHHCTQYPLTNPNLAWWLWTRSSVKRCDTHYYY